MIPQSDLLPHPAAGRSAAATDWSWTEALATARPGNRYRLARVPITLARNRFQELGIGEGDEVTCAGNGGGVLVLERADRRRLVLERTLAWFVQVEIPSPGGPGQ